MRLDLELSEFFASSDDGDYLGKETEALLRKAVGKLVQKAACNSEREARKFQPRFFHAVLMGFKEDMKKMDILYEDMKKRAEEVCWSTRPLRCCCLSTNLIVGGFPSNQGPMP